MIRIFSAVVLLMAFGLIPMAGGQAEPPQNPGDLQGDAENGKILYKQYTCYGCHGYTGETGFATRLNPPRMRQARFIAYLRNPTNPARMPPYQQSEVSNQKLANIYAFLHSLPSASPHAESIPLLQAILAKH